MIKCEDKKLSDFTESDILALVTLMTKEIAKIIDDAEALDIFGEVMSAVGTNLTLLARIREKELGRE